MHTAQGINDKGIAGAKLADGAVTSAKIADGAVGTADLAAKAVTDAMRRGIIFCRRWKKKVFVFCLHIIKNLCWF